MPAKGLKEALVLIINVGISTSGSDGVKILEKFKLISKYLIERRIFLQLQTEIGLVLMGSANSKNNYSIVNVEEYFNVQVPNWDILDDIMALESTDYKTNWLAAVQVALSYMENECDDAIIKKIVLLSDFKEELKILDDSACSSIADALTKQGVQLVVINKEEIGLLNADESNLVTNELLLKKLCVKVHAINLTLSEALENFRFYKKGEQPKSAAWPCNLEIADIKIPIAAYVKITEESKFPAWRQVVGKTEDTQTIELTDPVKVERQMEYFDRHREFCKAQNTTVAYMYGGQPVPFTEEDEKSMVYKSGEKCYKVCSFTHKKHVGIKYWNTGSSTRIVVPRMESAAKSFYSLIQAMVDMDLVAIVRKAYNASATPRMVGLFPCINVPDEPWCLVEIELPFAEDRRLVGSRPLKSILKELTKEQDKAVDDLLNSLKLPVDDASECTQSCADLYMPGCMHNPAIQHTWDMLSFRATNPEKPLPGMAAELKKMLEPPAFIKEKAAPHLERIKNLFDLTIPKDDMKKERKKNVKDDESGLPEQSPVKKDNIPDNCQTDDIRNTPVLSLDTSDIDLEDLAANI